MDSECDIFLTGNSDHTFRGRKSCTLTLNCAPEVSYRVELRDPWATGECSQGRLAPTGPTSPHSPLPSPGGGARCAVAGEMFVTYADLNLLTDSPLARSHRGEVDQRFRGCFSQQGSYFADVLRADVGSLCTQSPARDTAARIWAIPSTRAAPAAGSEAFFPHE